MLRTSFTLAPSRSCSLPPPRARAPSPRFFPSSSTRSSRPTRAAASACSSRTNPTSPSPEFGMDLAFLDQGGVLATRVTANFGKLRPNKIHLRTFLVQSLNCSEVGTGLAQRCNRLPPRFERAARLLGGGGRKPSGRRCVHQVETGGRCRGWRSPPRLPPPSRGRRWRAAWTTRAAARRRWRRPITTSPYTSSPARIRSGKLSLEVLAQAFYNRGIAYGGMAEFERALEDYSTAIGLAPDFAAAYKQPGCGSWYGKRKLLK